MKHSKQSLILVILLTSFTALSGLAQDNTGSPTVAQELYIFHARLKLEQAQKEQVKRDRAKEVLQDNEYRTTGNERGTFLSDPLMLDGKPLDYGEFDIRSTGELTVNKGASATGKTERIAFYVYLRRDGDKVLIAGKEKPDAKQLKVEISEILYYAEPGDFLVIEAVNEEDGAVKRILKVLGGGC